MSLRIIGEELYWRFGEFERLLKHNINKELTRCFGEDWINDIVKYDKSKAQLSRADIDMLEYYNHDEVQFTGIVNDLSVEDEYYRVRGEIGKLSLGFWIKIIEKWGNIEDIILFVPDKLILQFAENFCKENDFAANGTNKEDLQKLFDVMVSKSQEVTDFLNSRPKLQLVSPQLKFIFPGTFGININIASQTIGSD